MCWVVIPVKLVSGLHPASAAVILLCSKDSAQHHIPSTSSNVSCISSSSPQLMVPFAGLQPPLPQRVPAALGRHQVPCVPLLCPVIQLPVQVQQLQLHSGKLQRPCCQGRVSSYRQSIQKHAAAFADRCLHCSRRPDEGHSCASQQGQCTPSSSRCTMRCH